MKRKIIKVFLLILMRITYRIKIIGKENIPATGKYILCGNLKRSYIKVRY